DERGLNLYSWPEEGGLGKAEGTPPGPENPFPNGETMTYYPVPFFVSSKGYGFWLDSTWRNEFRLASDRPDAWRVWDIGPTLAYDVFLPIPHDSRPWPQQLVDEFTAKTGRPMVPPKWAFGPRRRINRETMIDGVPEIQAMRDHDLALTAVDDALHFLPAGSEIGIEPTVAAWVKSCAALGLRAECYYNPYISKDPSPLDSDAQTGLQNGWFLKDDTGAPSVVWLISGKFLSLYTVDVTQPAAVSWFTSMFSRALSLGYSGWMYDFGEYVQPNVVAKNGMTGEQLHNLFPVLYDKAAHDALEKVDPGDWYFFARSGYTGSSQYTPVVWSGDPDASFDDALGLPAMIRAGVNMGLSGVPHWGSDIGGYKCTSGHSAADGELLARWIEFGAVGSDMHDEDACSDAMDAGQKATIWTSPDAQAAWFTYARLHTRLFPYLYTLALAAHQTGAPTMRALFFEHPDPALIPVDDELYLGPALLAAPVVVRGARTRTVVLPDDSYLDWQDPALYVGPKTVTVAAPLGKLPLFLRDGYLVPLLDPSIDTLNDVADPSIVGPADVAGVYDVAGLITTKKGGAELALYDGTELHATFTGALAAPSPPNPLATSEAELATCAACYLVTPGAGFQRARVTMTSGKVTLGGLTLQVKSPRRIRFDLYLAPSP
ncbi:MAG: glycoside hydrolase family 31 protein, partial [Polyangia bacterium]